MLVFLTLFLTLFILKTVGAGRVESSEKLSKKRKSNDSRVCCTSCQNWITNGANIFNCIIYGNTMHLTNTCTGFSEIAINGIKEIKLNFLLICNGFLGTNQQDIAIDCLAKCRFSQLNEEKLTSFVTTISSLQELVDNFPAVSPIKMKYSDAARTARLLYIQQVIKFVFRVSLNLNPQIRIKKAS